MAVIDEVNDGVIRRTSFVIKIDPKEPMELFINEVIKVRKKSWTVLYLVHRFLHSNLSFINDLLAHIH